MGKFWLYTGNGKKLGWLCHQLEKLRRKAKLLNQNHAPHMPFHTSLLCPPLCNTSHFQSSLAYIEKTNGTILQHFQYCIVIHFSCQVPPCNLEAYSPLKVPDSQRWGVSTAGCPRHKRAVQKKKRSKQKPLINPHVLNKVHEQDRENRFQDRLWILVQDDFSISHHISQETGSSKGRAATGLSVAELPRCSRSCRELAGHKRCICKHKGKT